MRAKLVSPVLLPALLFACSSSTPARIEPSPITALPSSAAPTMVSTAALAPPTTANATPAETAGGMRGRDMPPVQGERFALVMSRVGETCGGVESTVRLECGRKGRTGYGEGRATAQLLGSALPKTGTRFASRTTSNGASMKMFSVVVTNTRVLVEEPCIVCRISSTDYRVASLDDATDEQLVKLQVSLGIMKQPAMRTESGWNKALLAVADRL